MEDLDHLFDLVVGVVRHVDAARKCLFSCMVENEELIDGSFLTSIRAWLISFIIGMVSQLSGGALRVIVATFLSFHK